MPEDYCVYMETQVEHLDSIVFKPPTIQKNMIICHLKGTEIISWMYELYHRSFTFLEFTKYMPEDYCVYMKKEVGHLDSIVFKPLTIEKNGYLSFKRDIIYLLDV